MAILMQGWTFSTRRRRSATKGRCELRKVSLVTTLLLLALSALTMQSARPVIAVSQSGRVIDVYTQKAPFDGRGINQSSDAFQPQELVILNANVTYNDAPVAQKAVSFLVNGPPNSFENITLLRTATSDQNGMANVSFRIPWPDVDPEKKVFGKWSVIATVDIADQTAVDTLTFQVGYILRITSVVTLNDELSPQTRFLRQEMVVFNLTVENIALAEKPGTITVDVQDAEGHPIMHIEAENKIFQPGITSLLVSSVVPITATLGSASVSAAVFTAPPENKGVLYGPAASSTFEIITRDVAVIAVRPSNSTVTSGETVIVTVTVRNKGDETESFNVTLYYDNVVIDRKLVANLAPQTDESIVFEWNTSGVVPGVYVLKAIADKVPGEIDFADNTFVDGAVMILAVSLPSIMLQWTFFFLIFIVGVIGSLILLLFLGYLRRRRRKRKPLNHHFIVVARPHI
jgi:hypothetical protein